MKKNDPHTKKVLRLFKWFLKCHGVVDSYKRNLKRDIRNPVWATTGEVHKIKLAEDMVIYAFSWVRAGEGWDHWSSLHVKWQEICDAFNL